GTLVQKHRGRGVFLDTNLLVLLLVGRVNVRRISNFKRAQDFTIEDFQALSGLVNWFGPPLVATPHVLSQASDLTDLSGAELAAIRGLFRATVQSIDEKYNAAKELVDHPLFSRFGLGDASVAAVCQRNIAVLTTDVQLQIALPSQRTG